MGSADIIEALQPLSLHPYGRRYNTPFSISPFLPLIDVSHAECSLCLNKLATRHQTFVLLTGVHCTPFALLYAVTDTDGSCVTRVIGWQKAD